MKKLQFFYQRSDKVVFFSLVYIFLIIVFIFGVFLLSSNQLPVKIPLFYSLPWGEPQLADKNQFLILPATLTLITLINSAIALQLHKSQQIFKRVIFLTTALIALLTLITSLKIITIFT